jgi:hypothetical protein
VNGGPPLAAPLRALRFAPVLVDDVGPIAQLAATAALLSPADLPLDAAELVRWTRAWLVAFQGALHDAGAIGGAQPWTVPLPHSELPALKSDPEGRRRAAALTLLERTGLLASDRATQAVALDVRAFVPHRAGLEVAWGAVGRAVRWEPAPLLVARALADLVVPAEQPVPVTLRELVERTGYAAKQVRAALRRLADERVIEASEAPGAPSEYRFGIVALPRAAEASETAEPPAPSPARLALAAPDARPVSPEPPLGAASARRVALRMTLNGVTVSLGAGLSPHVELGPDGIPHLTFDPPGPG